MPMSSKGSARAQEGQATPARIRGFESLAEAWRDLLQSPSHMKKLGEQGRLGVEKHYSLDAMRDTFIAVMESLVQSESAR